MIKHKLINIHNLETRIRRTKRTNSIESNERRNPNNINSGINMTSNFLKIKMMDRNQSIRKQQF